MLEYLKFKELCESIDHYPAQSELIYKYGFKREEVNRLIDDKLNDKDYVKTGLHGENGSQLIYWNKSEILTKFSGSQDLIKNSVLNEFTDLRDSELIKGFVFSEIESSLSIEGVRSTRAKIEKINKMNYENLIEENDIIIKNMLLAYEFVKENEITEGNIFAMYRILSRKCLKQVEQLLEGNYYRHDEVNIVDSANAVVDRGVKWQLIPKLMAELFKYIHKEKTYQNHLIASHVIHFYLVYIHPYFDYNGRMARVLSFWYNIKYAPSLSLLLVSEAINSKAYKNNYYTALSNSRNMDNDITYFLEYMSNIILEYTKVYINFYSLLKKLKSQGHIPSRSTEIALKYVLALPNSKVGFFDWRDYKDFTNDDFSKVQYLKLLNSLVDLNILKTQEHKKAKLFTLNQDDWNLM